MKSCMKILVSFMDCEAGNIIFVMYEKNFQDTGTSYNYFFSFCV